VSIRVLLFTVLYLFLLSGCIQRSYPPITEDSFLFTLNLRDASLSFVNDKGEMFAEWKMDELYTGGVLLPDHDQLLLYGNQLEQADIYSLSKGERIKQFEVPEGMTGVLYSKELNEFIFANKEDRSLYFYNMNGEKIRQARTGRYPMTLEEYNGYLYVVNYQDTYLSKINLKTGETVQKINIPTSSTGLLIRPEEGELLVGGHGQGTKPQSSVQIISLESGRKVGELYAPLMPVDFLEEEGCLYILSHGTNMIYRYNQEKILTEERPIGANPFEVESFGSKIAVAGYDNNKVYFLHPDTLTIEKEIKVGEGPFIIFVKE